MGVARFYHVTQGPVEATVPKLLRRALDAGLRVEVRGVAAEPLARLDDLLWLGDPAEFLPHGLAGGAHDALQPILLTHSPVLDDQTDCLMSIDGAPVESAEITRLNRTFILFDGNDSQAIGHARGQWKLLTGDGIGAEYWSEESGRWQQKAASPAR